MIGPLLQRCMKNLWSLREAVGSQGLERGISLFSLYPDFHPVLQCRQSTQIGIGTSGGKVSHVSHPGLDLQIADFRASIFPSPASVFAAPFRSQHKVEGLPETRGLHAFTT